MTGPRPTYTATTGDAAEQALEALAAFAVGDRSPAVVNVRRVVDTTNAIESMNYQLRKVTKTRGQFLGRMPEGIEKSNCRRALHTRHGSHDGNCIGACLLAGLAT